LVCGYLVTKGELPRFESGKVDVEFWRLAIIDCYPTPELSLEYLFQLLEETTDDSARRLRSIANVRTRLFGPYVLLIKFLNE